MAYTRIDTFEPRDIAFHLALLNAPDEVKQKARRLRVNCSSYSDEGEDWSVVLVFDDDNNIILRRVLPGY